MFPQIKDGRLISKKGNSYLDCPQVVGQIPAIKGSTAEWGLWVAGAACLDPKSGH